jgi:DnaJ-class molecular chaperone
MKKRTRKPGPFDKGYTPRYGTYKGEHGSPDQWQQAFGARFSNQEIHEILGEDDPWGILGLKPGASQSEIKSAFRKKAVETHPDRNPHLNGDTGPFRKVKAAFDKLSA